MKKKILALCLVVVLGITAVTGVTLAYFTDSEQVTNTMTIGDVKINIEELVLTDRDGDGTPEWNSFVNDEFTLYPIENEQGIESYNKVVYTFNTSKEHDAYIRTIVLIEANDKITAENETGCCFPGIHYGYDSDSCKEFEPAVRKVTIDNEEYYVVAFVDFEEKAVAVGDKLISLHSIWLDENVKSEEIAGWGDKVEVKVLSQAIQATGLTHGEAMTELGTITADELTKWFAEAEQGVVNDDAYERFNPTTATEAAPEGNG